MSTNTNESNAITLRCAVITISDRSADGQREDLSGPAAVAVLTEAGCEVVNTSVVPDSRKRIRQAVKQAIDAGARALLLTGGTGIGPRDRTPEAVKPLLSQKLSGIGEELRRRGIAAGAPGALLSRAFGGIIFEDAGAVLIIAAPGSEGGARDGAELLVMLGEHTLRQFAGADHEGASE